MSNIISNIYPLENKKHKDLIQISNLGLRSFWKLHYGNDIPLSIEEEFHFTTNEEGKVAQFKRGLFVQKDHTYIVTFEVECSAYQSGKLGIGFGGTRNTVSISEVTQGFIRVQKMITFPESKMLNIFFGGIKKADLTGTIRNILMLDITK